MMMLNSSTVVVRSIKLKLDFLLREKVKFSGRTND